MATMKKRLIPATVALLVLLRWTAVPATSSRYDGQIQQAVSQKLQKDKQLKDVTSSVEDGIVTLTGTVNLYQDKLDAMKKITKLSHVNGVRNNIVVAGEQVSDS